MSIPGQVKALLETKDQVRLVSKDMRGIVGAIPSVETPYLASLRTGPCHPLLPLCSAELEQRDTAPTTCPFWARCRIATDSYLCGICIIFERVVLATKLDFAALAHSFHFIPYIKFFWNHCEYPLQ